MIMLMVMVCSRRPPDDDYDCDEDDDGPIHDDLDDISTGISWCHITGPDTPQRSRPSTTTTRCSMRTTSHAPGTGASRHVKHLLCCLVLKRAALCSDM